MNKMRNIIILIITHLLSAISCNSQGYYMTMDASNRYGINVSSPSNNILMIYLGDSYIRGNPTYNTFDSLDLIYQGEFPTIIMYDNGDMNPLNTANNNNLMPESQRANNFSFPLIMNYNLSLYYDTVYSLVYGYGGTQLTENAQPDWNINSVSDLYAITENIILNVLNVLPTIDSTNTYVIFDLSTNDLIQGNVNSVLPNYVDLIRSYVDSFPQIKYQNIAITNVIDFVSSGYATQAEQDTVEAQVQAVYDSLNLGHLFDWTIYPIAGDDIHIRSVGQVDFADSNYLFYIQ